MNKASGQDIQRLRDSADEVLRLISAGETPTDAVVKVAGDRRLTQEWTSRLAEISNRLLTLDHFETAGTQKAASHPLVEIDAVRRQLFPTTLRKVAGLRAGQAVVEPVLRDMRNLRRRRVGELTEKVAAVSPPEPHLLSNEQDILRRAELAIESLKMADSDHRVALAESHRQAGLAAKIASRAILRGSVNPLELEERAVAWYGRDAVTAMDIAAQHINTKLARLQAEPRIFTTNPWDRSPYREFGNLVITIRQEAVKVAMADDIHAVAAKVRGVYESLLHTLATGTKVAAISLDPFLGLRERAAVPADASADRDIRLAGISPEDVAMINGLRAREALVGALRDPVVARADLGRVMRAYNILGDSSPRGMLNEATLTALLRSSLEREQEPFDIERAQSIERGLSAKDDVLNL